MRSFLAWFVAIGMVGAALAGCGGSNGTPLGPGSSPNGQSGGPPNNNSTYQIRVLNGSPDFGPIDVYVDGARTWQNVKYAFFGTTGSVTNAPFLVTTLQPTAHNIAVVQAGATLAAATTQASVTTSSTSQRVTIVVADKVFGTLTFPALVALAFSEPTVTAPGTSTNVLLHHASPSGSPGTLAYGSLSLGSTSNFLPTALGTLTYSNPPGPLSIVKLPYVNTGGSPIGYYVANSGGSQPCSVDPTQPRCIPSATFFAGNPASQYATPPPIPPGGFVFPSPPPNPAGQPSPAPFDCSNTLPPSCNGAAASALSALPNLSIYAIDSPPITGQTVPGVALVGVWDPNNI